MRDINLTHIAKVRYGHETTLVQDGSNTVAQHLSSRWGASFFPYCMREGEPSLLFLDGEGMSVAFTSPHWSSLEVASM